VAIDTALKILIVGLGGKAGGILGLVVICPAGEPAQRRLRLPCAEYFVPVEWIHTVSDNAGFQEVGAVEKQNKVCKPVTPKWRSTVEQLIPPSLPAERELWQ
jgi:hypothetical protein